MPGGSRSLPGHPSLRHLKLEAKRRLAAGEFLTLHDAQVAIAREHGLPTWAALKQRVSDIPDSHDATAAVTTRIRDQRTHVVLTSRMIPVNSIETRLLRAWTNP